MSNRFASNVSLLLIVVQELASGEPVFSEKLHYALSEDPNTDFDTFPEWDTLLSDARALHEKHLAAGGYQSSTYRFYGMYHDEPQSYDGLTTAMIPVGLPADDRDSYATAAAALTLMEDNDSEDILSNFTLENIYQDNSSQHSIPDATRILTQLVNNIQSTGGLINCQGTYVPAIDPEWSDLGDTVYQAHQYLVKSGESSASALTITDFDGSVDDYLDENN